MAWSLVVALHLVLGTALAAGEQQLVTLSIDTGLPAAKINDNFVCATLDWWPPEKCDYGTCSWGRSSLLNLDLSNERFQKAVKGLAPVLLRLGGSLQDQIVYEVGSSPGQCLPLVKQGSGMFGFTGGCLNMSRWQQLNAFFKKTGASVAFGLNALYGRKDSKGSYTQPWSSTNARDLIQYSVNRGYNVVAWELGNELSGSGVGTSISAQQYAANMKELRSIVNSVYANSTFKPLVVAPDGFYDEGWYRELVQRSEPGAFDVLSHHIYNLGPGVDTHLVQKILDPSYLNGEASVFGSLRNILTSSGSWAQAWVGEAGGAYNSGHHNVTDRFVFSFWYLDQLGMAAVYNTSVYCRQSLIGGNYGLVSNSFDLNPDYFSALIWKKLMGNAVFSTKALTNSPFLRTYAHCLKNNQGGLAVLLINLSNSTEYLVDLSLTQKTSCSCKTKTPRSEYHLRALGDNIQSPTMLLNGKPLQASEDGSIPSLEPIFSSSSSSIAVLPFSIVFAAIPDAGIVSCS